MKKIIGIAVISLVATALLSGAVGCVKKASLPVPVPDETVAPPSPTPSEGEQEPPAQPPAAPRLLASFSTSYATSGEARSINVSTACDNFDWTVVAAGERFSFNAAVGPRTEERGYRTAKVIENGEYVQGVGGGVCQVSTTLYNAWIRAGLGIVDAKAHTLPASYCLLSQDATVSEYIDLVLINDGPSDVLINGTCRDKILTFEIHGQPDGNEYAVRSETVREIAPAAPLTLNVASLEGLGNIESDEDGRRFVRTAPKSGWESKAYLETRREGKLVAVRELRHDWYAPVRGKICVLSEIE